MLFESKNQPENKFNYFLICLVKAWIGLYCKRVLEVLVRANVDFSFDGRLNVGCQRFL